MNRINFLYRKIIEKYRGYFFLSSKELSDSEGKELPKLFLIEPKNDKVLENILNTLIIKNAALIVDEEPKTINTAIRITKRFSRTKRKVQFIIRFYNFKIMNGTMIHFPGYIYKFILWRYK